MDGNLPGAGFVKFFPDPPSAYRYLDLLRTSALYLKWGIAIALGPGIFLDDIGPAARADINALARW